LISLGGFFLTKMKSPRMADEIARVLRSLHARLTNRRSGDAIERASMQIERWLPAPRTAAPRGTLNLLAVRAGQNKK
jgi:hypothetical protein